MKKLFIVNSDYHDTRIDRWLKNNFSTLNQSFIEKNLRKGNIKVNDSKIAAKYKLNFIMTKLLYLITLKKLMAMFP